MVFTSAYLFDNTFRIRIMDIKEIDSISEKLAKVYLEQRIIDEEIVGKAIIFFNQYYNLTEHPITREDIEKLSSVDFSLKLDFLFWKSLNPQTDTEINWFYEITPYDFFRNLLKNMDVMHYEKILKGIVIPYLRKESHQVVLDYGGGRGYLAILLHKIGLKVSFAEINKVSIEWMRYITKELNFDIEVIDLLKQEIENNYDIILLKDVLEHLPGRNHIKNLLEKLAKHTKILFIFPNKMTKEEDYMPMHFNYELRNG